MKMKIKILILLISSMTVSSCISIVGPEGSVNTNTKVPSSEVARSRKCKKVYKVLGKSYCVLNDARGFEQVGMASWYGPNFHGKKTATGEIYNMYEMTAAHKTLPLGTYVKVINLENGKSVVVRINDRGPFVAGRIIDLSYEAARRLGIVAKGTAKVKIIALGKKVDHHYEPENYQKGAFYVQLGVFKSRENAEKFAKRLKGIEAKVIRAFGLYRVVVGPELTYVKAAELKTKLKKQFPNAFIMTID